jgi:nucleoside-diphosphate-sugar epimerase
VVHTASPIPFKVPDDENEVVKPAVEGTLAVMRAAHKHKVKRVVITSSGLTVYTKKPENQKDLYSEEDWSDLEMCGPYEKSKVLAERAAWDFLASLPEEERFELTVIIPTFILGPPLVEGDFFSGNHCKNMLLGLWPGVPKVMMAVADVRNVAQGHLRGLKVPEASNERIIITNRTFFFRDLCKKFIDLYGEGTYPVKLEEMKECPPDNKRFKSIWEKNFNVNHAKSEKLLGIEYIDINDTLRQMTEKMIENGLIPDLRKKKE